MRQNTPTPVASGTQQGGPRPSKIEEIVRDLHDQIRHVVALIQMHRVLAYSPDVTPLFNDTSEAWGYSVVQQSVLVELVFALCRLHDNSPDTNSLPTLFGKEAATSKSKRWLSTLPGPRRCAFAQANSLWSQLRGSHLLSRLTTLRNKFWGHSATQRTGLQMPKYGYVDDLYGRTKKIVQLLAFAALDTDPNFEDAEQVWEQHANRFFRVLAAGQRGAARS